MHVVRTVTLTTDCVHDFNTTHVIISNRNVERFSHLSLTTLCAAVVHVFGNEYVSACRLR
jgi:hypothetical protein